MYILHTFGLLQELEWKRERTENDLSSHVSRRATSSHHASSRFGFSHCVQCHSQGRQRTTAEQMRNVMKVKAPSSRLLLQEFIALEAIPSNTLKGLSSYAYLLKSLKSTLRGKIRQLKIHKHNRLKVNLLWIIYSVKWRCMCHSNSKCKSNFQNCFWHSVLLKSNGRIIFWAWSLHLI